jgi:hypothetical protein
MANNTAVYLADDDRSCGECRGRKVTAEPTARGTTIYETCCACGGSGANSIRIIEVRK